MNELLAALSTADANTWAAPWRKRLGQATAIRAKPGTDGTVATTRRDDHVREQCQEPVVGQAAGGHAAAVQHESSAGSLQRLPPAAPAQLQRSVGTARLVVGRRDSRLPAPFHVAPLPLTPGAVGRQRYRRNFLSATDGQHQYHGGSAQLGPVPLRRSRRRADPVADRALRPVRDIRGGQPDARADPGPLSELLDRISKRGPGALDVRGDRLLGRRRLVMAGATADCVLLAWVC